jgi:glycerol-3-phosphate dehydrogenase
VTHEFCCSLEDYLRRRTNIAQWLPRGGLGRKNENLPIIKALASKLPKWSGQSENDHIQRYTKTIKERHDAMIAMI